MSAKGITVHRVTFNASDEQVEWLNALAARHSVAVSDVLRRLIDETRGAYITPAEARRAQLVEGVTTIS
jgi:hypothetical protein